MRGATAAGKTAAESGGISIHAPRAGRDCCCRANCSGKPISIHAPRAGRDATADTETPWDDEFQSTRPVRGATALEILQLALGQISIHAPRAGRDQYAVNKTINW